MAISEGQQITSTVYNNAHGILTTSSTVGCFSQPTPLVDHGPYQWQSSGNCQNICAQLNQPVFALQAGSNCSCASELPSKDSLVKNSQCTHVCNGFKENCGGTDTWLVFLTGLPNRDVEYVDAPSPKKGSSGSSSASESVVTVGGQTIVKTVPGSASTDTSGSSSKSHSGSNTAGIAAGVVVGIVLLAAIIIGVLFFLRRRRRIATEKDYQNRQSVQQFVVGGKSPFASRMPLNDSRLDQEFMSSRRQSDGSIMDNQDYSRRILQVTNPDGR